jgi:hypothetical protein
MYKILKIRKLPEISMGWLWVGKTDTIGTFVK